MRNQNESYQPQPPEKSLLEQMDELIKDIGASLKNYLQYRRPTAGYCPTIMVKLLSFIPGLGHIFIGFYIRGIMWLVIMLPVIAAFIFVVVDVGFVNMYTLEAIGGMYLILVIFCIRDVSHLLNDVCGTERSIAYFKRQKAANERYQQFVNRQYSIKPDEDDSNEVAPKNQSLKKHEGEWR
jgi:hypothetical protein